ncbi:hypothetical protein Tco_0020484 [Tanacetum coccineum]
MNQNFYNSNSFGFDQLQPPQNSVIHHPPQETSVEILQARENLMETIQAFLNEYDHIPPKDKCMALLLAEERFLKIKQVVEEEQNQPEVMQDLLLKLMNDLQILNGIQPKQEEQTAQIEEFASELDLIDLILPGIDEDDFDEEEGEIDIDIFQIKDEILREKLLNFNLLIDKIEAFNLIPSIPFEVDTFLVPEDSIPPGIESDFDSEGDIIFLNYLLNDDPILEYERFTFDIEPFDELNKDECFYPGGGEINVSQNVEDDDSFTFVIRNFLPFLTYPEDSPLLLSTRSEDTIFDPRIST